MKKVECHRRAVLRIRDVFIPDPDPTIAPSRIRIPDPGGKKAPDPGSDLFFFIKAINKFSLLIPDPGSGSDNCSIPDPGSGG
jgi:hypothetical protein